MSEFEKEYLDYAVFFIDDLKKNFHEKNFKSANWNNVKNAMLKDKDVCYGALGKIFYYVLLRNM